MTAERTTRSDAMPRHHNITVNGTRVHYLHAGSGPTVMLLHGWPQTSHEWRHVIADLAVEHTVIVPDLRGCGYSGKPASGYDGTSVAADLAGLADHLDLDQFVVLGHDWGAAFGYLLAAQERDRVRGFGVIEMVLPGLGVMEQAMVPQPDGNFLWHLGFQSVPDIPELLIRGHERAYLHWFFTTYAHNPAAITPGDLDEYVSAITQVGALRAGLQIYREFFTTASQIAAAAADPLAIPVVAYGGAASAREMTLLSVRAVAPDATGGVIPDCGHWVAEERPDFVVDLVRQLVRDAGIGEGLR